VIGPEQATRPAACRFSFGNREPEITTRGGLEIAKQSGRHGSYLTPAGRLITLGGPSSPTFLQSIDPNPEFVISRPADIP